MAKKRVKITQTRSTIRHLKTQLRTLQALGLGRIGQSVEQELTPSVSGMVKKVSHLVTVYPI